MKKLIVIISIFMVIPLMLIGCSSESSNDNNFDKSKTNNEIIKSNSNNTNNNDIKQKDTSKDNTNDIKPKDTSKDTSKESKVNILDKNDTKNNIKSKDCKDFNQNKDNKNNKDKITIVIDPGHSTSNSNEKEPNSPDSKEMKLKDTSGATGVCSKVPEYSITHGVSLELEKILKKEGYNVILTKREPSTKLSNIERTQIANKNNANLMIRIHCDGVDSPKAKGASILVPSIKGSITPKIAKRSFLYGEKIIDSYTKYTGLKNRGVVVRNDLTGFNWSKIPIVLIELGFISNPKEDAYLSNKSNYTKIATGISNGINACFK